MTTIYCSNVAFYDNTLVPVILVINDKLVPPHGSRMDWKMGKLFPVRKKSGNFTQITGKNEWILPRMMENENILANFNFFYDLLIEVHLLNRFFVFVKFIK